MGSGNLFNSFIVLGKEALKICVFAWNVFYVKFQDDRHVLVFVCSTYRSNSKDVPQNTATLIIKTVLVHT